MSASHIQTAVRPSRAIRFFSGHAEQEDETLRYWESRTMDQRLEALGELLRSPRPLSLVGETRVESSSPRVARLFKDRDEQEAWNLQRAADGKRS